MFFFFGVVLAIGGLGFIGYLGVTSKFIYGELGATNANILVGVLSAIVDNIPVMFAVLSMQPDMSEFQWLLVTKYKNQIVKPLLRCSSNMGSHDALAR